MKNVKLELNRREGVSIVGFTLKGIGDTDAEAFCISFMRAQELGKADVFFDGDEVVFKHEGVSLKDADPKHGIYGSSEGGEFRASISCADREQLSQLLELKGSYQDHRIFVKPELVWGKGFTLYVKK